MPTLYIKSQHFANRSFELEIDEKGEITRLTGYVLPIKPVTVTINVNPLGSKNRVTVALDVDISPMPEWKWSFTPFTVETSIAYQMSGELQGPVHMDAFGRCCDVKVPHYRHVPLPKDGSPVEFLYVLFAILSTPPQDLRVTGVPTSISAESVRVDDMAVEALRRKCVQRLKELQECQPWYRQYSEADIKVTRFTNPAVTYLYQTVTKIPFPDKTHLAFVATCGCNMGHCGEVTGVKLEECKTLGDFFKCLGIDSLREAYDNPEVILDPIAYPFDYYIYPDGVFVYMGHLKELPMIHENRSCYSKQVPCPLKLEEGHTYIEYSYGR